ncbi:hypothetical protein ACI6Q2_12205 [Chitinophagaceae bacterium LWZ2-11]
MTKEPTPVNLLLFFMQRDYTSTKSNLVQSRSAANNSQSKAIAVPAPGKFKLQQTGIRKEQQPLPGKFELQQQRSVEIPRATSSTGNVVQRALLTKKDIFEDQVKWVIVQGIFYHLTSKSGSEQGKKLVDLFDSKGIISINLFENRYPKSKLPTQKKMFEDEKSDLLKDILLQNLQKNDVVMDAVAAADIARAKWDLYKTEIDNQGKAEGYSGEIEGNKSNSEAKTTIQWQDAQNGQGKGVTANILAPDHPLGSPPGDTIKDKVDELSGAAGNKPYIAGHLLNNNLGGPGNSAMNLTAIPSDVNSEMSQQVENEVIKRVNKNHEIVYYKVDVNYLQDAAAKNMEYASKFTIEFGSYKEGIDFSKASTGDLEEMHKYVIPINSPTTYGNVKAGYNKDSKKETYTDESDSKEYDWEKPKKANDPAKLNFNTSDNIILKDTTQIKLEFISFAIYSLKINELNEKIKELELEKDNTDIEFNDLKNKYESLQNEIKTITELKKQIELIQPEFEQSKEQLQETIKAKEELKIQLKEQLKTAKFLQEKLDDYITKTRERAESYGYVFGLDDGEAGRESSVKGHLSKKRISLGSEDPFTKGYQNGYEKGRKQFKQEEENRKKDEKIIKLEEEGIKKDERIKELEELVKLLELKQTTSDIKEKITSSSLSNVNDTKEQEKEPFGDLVKRIFKEEGVKGTSKLNEAAAINMPKYDYLAILVFLKLITHEEAYDAYPNTEYLKKFKSLEYQKDVFDRYNK